MPLTFFSPNSRNQGGALFASFNSKEEAGFFQVIQQNGWNEQTKKGIFKDGKRLNVKLSLDELAGILYAIENKTEFKFYHSFGESVTTGSFVHWSKDGRSGFGLSVKKGEDIFRVSFAYESATKLREYLKFALEHIFSAIYSSDKKDAEEFAKKKQERQAAAQPETEQIETVDTSENPVEVW